MNTYFQTFAGSVLYHSEHMFVRQNLFYRWLCFQNDACIQTLLCRRHPQKVAMPYLLPLTAALRAQPGPTCLLGLGGGAVVHLIAPYLHPYDLMAVEASPEVIALGQKYFGLNLIKPLTIVQGAAQTFITQPLSNYQHIIIDLYSDMGFPKACAELSFFQNCKQRLQLNGFLALNLVGIHQEFYVLEQLKLAFPQATLCIQVPHSNNMIVLATHSRAQLFALIESYLTPKSLIWDPVFGCIARLKHPKFSLDLKVFRSR